MITEIFVAERQREDPLAQEMLRGVFNPFLCSMVMEASRKAFQETELTIGLAEQERATI